MNLSISTAESSSCICLMTLYGEKTEIQKNVVRILLKFRSMLAGFLAVVGHSWDLDQKIKRHKTCSHKPNGNWDRTARMMMTLQLGAESGHPIFRASSSFERGELDSKEHDKKSTQFNDNEGHIEMLLRTVIHVNQLSVYGALADLCKELDKHSSDDSESSGTLYAKEVFRDETIIPRLYVMPENARCSPGGSATISETDTSRTSTASATRSAIQRRRTLRVLCRSQNLMAVLQRATEKPAGSIFIFNFAVASFTMANELEFMAAYIIWEMVVISVPGKNFRNSTVGVDRTPTHNTHLCSTVCSQARNAHQALGSSHTDCSVIFGAPEKDLSPGVAHVPPLLVASLAFHYEHVIFLILSSFHHDTRTRSMTGTT